MWRARVVGVWLTAVALAGCGGGDGGGPRAEPSRSTPPQPTPGPCAERLTFAETAWEAAPPPSPALPAGTVLWQARFTFTNPNSVEVRLSDAIVILEILTSDGHHGSTGRTAFADPAPATVGARSSLERAATALMRDGKIPETTQLYVRTAAGVGGSACEVPIDRVSTTPASPQVFTLPDCGSEPC